MILSLGIDFIGTSGVKTATLNHRGEVLPSTSTALNKENKNHKQFISKFCLNIHLIL